MVEHGGDLYTAAKVYAGEILDLSVNVNPLGAPPEVMLAVQESLLAMGRYPDPQSRVLRKRIAALDGVLPEQVFCGNGASDVLFRLAITLQPGVALLTAPTFGEYEATLRRAGWQCCFHRLQQIDNFDVTETILAQIQSPVKLVVLCNPNNPTGRLIPAALLQRILQRCREIGARLLLDECFFPLAQTGNGLASQLAQWPELFLLRAFTKTYAIPALRLGYGLGAPALVARLFEAGPCWNVSVIAQAAGEVCCDCPDWPAAGREFVAARRPALMAGLNALGCQVIPGSANYLLFRMPGIVDLKQRLLTRGILVRSCANYRQLSAQWYRISVQSEEENARFLHTLSNVLSMC